MRFFAIALTSLLPAWAAVEAVAHQKQDATNKISLRGGGGVGSRSSSFEKSGRDLMMDHKNFSPLTCNANVADSCATSATTLSSILASAAAGTMAAIPCGTCAIVDTTDGTTLSFPHGLNVEGMLHFPSSSNVVIETTHIFVQGVLKMDPPQGDNKVRIKMVGTDDAYLVPHAENSMACDMTTGCNVGKKAIVVAGGKLDIRGLTDTTCPAWTKLQSVMDPLAITEPTTPAPEGPSTHVLACGNSANIGACGSSYAPAVDTELHHVRCCSDTNLGSGWRKDDQCDVWGDSEVNGVCHKDSTYDGAVDLCTSAGARLCTADELLNDCTKWTGCGHDAELNWSSTPAPELDDGCPLDHDLLQAPDGTFETTPSYLGTSGFFQHHSGGSFSVAVDAEDGDNSYLAQTGRCCSFSGLGINLDTDKCAEVDGNNQMKYKFSFRYRIKGGDATQDNGIPSLQLQPQDGSNGCDHCRNVGSCPKGVDGEWVTCTNTITMLEREVNAPTVKLVIGLGVHSSKSIDYDDISFAAIPRAHELEVGSAAATCWGARSGDEVLVTNSDSAGNWMGQTVVPVISGDVALGSIDLGQSGAHELPSNPISVEEDADMASEVAWLSRAIVFEAEGDGPSDQNYDSLHGGHLIVLHTPGVAQHIEGVEIRNFGQQGNLGRYPIHFHMSGSVAGSVVRKNVIRESKQRCVVIHGSHDVLVEDNVSFDTYGHCYMLEDGGEEGNTFRNNLGARTRQQGISIGSSDHEPSTLWITNPVNHFIGNVCAGSQNMGVWFELRNFRAGLPLGTFKDNTAHSNRDKGMQTYAPGYSAPSEALFEGVKSYHNPVGLLLHGTQNVRVKDAFFGLNDLGVLYFANGGVNTFEDSTFVGRCGQEGIRFSFEARSTGQVKVSTTSFIGYTDSCASGSQSYAFKLESIQPKSDYDMPLLSNLSFDSNEVSALHISGPFVDKIVLAEDRDGTMNPSGSKGFFVNDAAHMTTFLDSGLCSSSGGGGLFCANTCLRRLIVDTGCCEKKFSHPEMDYQMVVRSKTDTSKMFVYDKQIIQSVLWYHANKFDLVLPFDDYTIHFLRVADGQVMVPAVTLSFRDESNLDDPPNCEHITAASIDFECPEGYELNADGVCAIPSPSFSPSNSGAPTISQAPTFKVVYLGCWADAEPRALPFQIRSPTDWNTIEGCQQKCEAAGYAYSGLQWSGNCWCGTDDYDKYGPAEGCQCSDGVNVGGWKNCVYGPSPSSKPTISPSPSFGPSNSGAPTISQAPTFEKPVYLGCWADAEPRALPFQIRSPTDWNTIEGCQQKCEAAGYAYSGLQWSGNCWCGTDDYDKYGPAEGCQCLDGVNVGGWKNCVYGPSPSSKPTISPSPTISQAPTFGGVVYLGCWADAKPRALPFQIRSPTDWNTIEGCQQKCEAAGYAYSGLQWSGNCWCGFDYDKYGPAEGCQCLDGVNVGGWKNCVYGPSPSPTISPTKQQCAEDSSCAVTNPCEAGTCNLETGLCGAPTPIEGCENGARLDTWLGIGGSATKDLTDNARYPYGFNTTQILGESLEAPTNIGDDYGNRLQTYIMPPVTCEWNFYIASDNQSKLYLSSNDDPANKSLVAYMNGWTEPRQWWNHDSQKGTRTLFKGELYYLEAIHKEQGGNDNLAIGWECLEHRIMANVIGAEYTKLPAEGIVGGEMES